MALHLFVTMDENKPFCVPPGLEKTAPEARKSRSDGIVIGLDMFIFKKLSFRKETVRKGKKERGRGWLHLPDQYAAE